MKKRESYREKHRRQETQRKRLIAIGVVALIAVIAVVVLILLNPPRKQAEGTVGQFTTVPTQTWPDANGKVLGSPNAKVVVQEFADYQCPVCKIFHDTESSKIITDYVATGKVRFEYHHFIVIDQNVGGTESRQAAEASQCANDQGKFWDYSNMLFGNQQSEGSGTFNNARLKAFAAAIGLDTAKFNACLDGHKDAAQVDADIARAGSYNLNSTPSLIVNDSLVQNPLDYTQVQAAIEAALKTAK